MRPIRILAVALLFFAAIGPGFSQSSPSTRRQPPPVIEFRAAPLQAASFAIPSVPAASPRIRAYNRIWYGLYFFGVAWTILGLSLMLKWRLGPKVRDLAERRTSSRIVQTGLFYAGYSGILTVWHLPVGLAGYLVERGYGFAKQSLGLWLLDRGRGYLLGLPTLFAIWFAYWLLRRSPKRWWLWLWIGSVPWIATQYALAPVVVAPLYNRFVPMPDSPLRSRLLNLAIEAGIGGAQVYQVDISRRTSKLNAYVAGLGPTKRIVLWDTTLKALSDDEIVAITGHEMGHYVLHHVAWGVAAGSLGSFLILWLLSRLLPRLVAGRGARLGIRTVDDLGSFPLVALVLTVILFVQTPIESAISRYEEHAADRYGLELTGLNTATARAFVEFVRRDYADPDPPPFIVFWFYTHPPIRERVDFALNYHHPLR